MEECYDRGDVRLICPLITLFGAFGQQDHIEETPPVQVMCVNVSTSSYAYHIIYLSNACNTNVDIRKVLYVFE